MLTFRGKHPFDGLQIRLTPNQSTHQLYTNHMNETEINTFLGVLENQRNTALNAVAKSETNNVLLRAQVAELEKALAAAKSEAKPA